MSGSDISSVANPRINNTNPTSSTPVTRYALKVGIGILRYLNHYAMASMFCTFIIAGPKKPTASIARTPNKERSGVYFLIKFRYLVNRFFMIIDFLLLGIYTLH